MNKGSVTTILTFPHRGGRDSQFLDVNVGVVRLECIVQRPCYNRFDTVVGVSSIQIL